LLAWPPTLTTMLPVVAPVGTGATMDEALQLIGDAAVPLKVTVLVPCVAPKLAPPIVTDAATAPEFGVRLEMLGTGLAEVTAKTAALLVTPLTVTITLPVVAPVGTGAMMVVAVQMDVVAAFPLKVIVLDP
ncbi:MAG: hypothetical protein WA002_07055, partial [Candidatus Acidiferrales bacterium]